MHKRWPIPVAIAIALGCLAVFSLDTVFAGGENGGHCSLESEDGIHSEIPLSPGDSLTGWTPQPGEYELLPPGRVCRAFGATAQNPTPRVLAELSYPTPRFFLISALLISAPFALAGLLAAVRSGRG